MSSFFKIAREEWSDWCDAFVMNMPGRMGILLRRCVLRFQLGSMGKRCLLVRGIRIYDKGGLSLGDKVGISAGVQIQARGGVTIGSNTLIGPQAIIWSINHRFDEIEKPIRDQGFTFAPVVIEEDVWIAAGAIVLAGVTIHRGAVVAAGAVVTKDVPSYSVVAGVPAIVVKWRMNPEGTPQMSSKPSSHQ